MNLTANIFRPLGRHAQDARRRGLAALEFALTLPIWLTLLVGICDGSYFLLVNQRTDRIAYTVTDIVTQNQTVSLATLNDIVLAAGQIMQPLTFGGNGTIIISSVYKPAGKVPTICWQYTGGGTLAQNSKLGSTGGTPTLPNGLTLNDNDNVIITEVFYNFKPLFITSKILSTSLIYRTAVYKPRLSQLTQAPS